MRHLTCLVYCMATVIVMSIVPPSNAQLTLSLTVDGVDAGKRAGEAVAYIGELPPAYGNALAFVVGGFYDAPNQYGWIRYYDVNTGALITSKSGGYNTHTDIDAYGSVLAGGQDMDGDTYKDGVVASYYGWGCGVSPRNAGDVAILWTASLGSGYNCFGGDVNGMEVGSSADMIADISGDGIGDVIAGGRSVNGGGVKRGRVYVYSPLLDSAHLLLNPYAGVIREYGGPDDNGMLGWSIAALGDVSGDGVPDMISGAPGDVSPAVSGKVYLLSGAASHTAQWIKGAGSAGTRFGYAVANAGDLDGDSKDDVVVGEPASTVGGSSPGRVWAYSGASGALLWTATGPNAGDSLGTRLAGIGDVDGDFKPDVAAAARGWNSNTGRVYVLSGADGSILGQVDGEDVGDQFGYDLSSGDFDLDGTDDLIVTAPAHASNLGRVYVYLAGSSASMCTSFSTPGNVAITTGDVNNDGNLTSADIIYMVNFVFKGGAAPLPCTAAGDVDCNGAVTSADIISMVNHVFKGGVPPCDVCSIGPGIWTCP